MCRLQDDTWIMIYSSFFVPENWWFSVFNCLVVIFCSLPFSSCTIALGLYGNDDLHTSITTITKSITNINKFLQNIQAETRVAELMLRGEIPTNVRALAMEFEKEIVRNPNFCSTIHFQWHDATPCSLFFSSSIEQSIRKCKWICITSVWIFPWLRVMWMSWLLSSMLALTVPIIPK